MNEQDGGGVPDDRGEILVVDDSLSSLRLLSSILIEAGYRVREAASGELALWTVKTRCPDLILLDVRMPVMDGFEVCRRLKAAPESRAVPVIFLSAQDETTDKVQGLAVGAVDFVTKSSAHEEILARIETHITLARVKSALEQERANLEQRVAERTAELLQGKGLLRSVIDSGPDWIYAVDRDCRLLLVNQNMARAAGVSTLRDLIGQPACRLFQRSSCFGTAGDRECQLLAEDRAVFAGQTIHLPCESIDLPDGTQRRYETYKTPLRELDGTIYGLLCYRREITERLRLEDERRVLERELWQARKMEAVGQLAGGIAHDFNNQLSLILGFAQFAVKALANGKPEKIDDYLAEILKAGRSAQSVVAQLLAFSRAEPAVATPLDLQPVVDQCLSSLRASTGQDIALAVKDGLPKVLIGADQVRQMLTNLVLNARDALDGNGAIDVAVRVQRAGGQLTCASCHQPLSGDYVRLSVRDQGGGIPAEIVERVFDPFFTTKALGKGTGLGLSMVHGIAHSAGGHVSILSSCGQGTTVSLWLPVVTP